GARSTTIANTSLWLGLCVYIARLDRTPRSYTFCLPPIPQASFVVICPPSMKDAAPVMLVASRKTARSATSRSSVTCSFRKGSGLVDAPGRQVVGEVQPLFPCHGGPARLDRDLLSPAPPSAW